MDSDGLPLVGPGIDYTKVESIHQKRTLAFLNHFITHTARFLNRFSCVCEEKLEDLSVRIQHLETSMSLLESKLASIPGLENVTAPAAASPASSAAPTDNVAAPVQAPESAEQVQPEPVVEEEVPEKPKMTVAQDPRYAKYFKMMNVGVPLAAFRLKMEAEGLDPDLMDTPDAPAPPGGEVQDDSDFSDRDSPESSDFDD